MGAGRRRRIRSKFKHGRAAKRDKTSRRAATDPDNRNHGETTHSLLLASLRFWEIERDLIEERIAAMGR